MDKPGEYAYLGYRGLLVPIACTGQVKQKQNKQRSEGMSLDGHRRILVYGSYMARAWSVSGDMPLHVAKNVLSIQSDSTKAHEVYSFLPPYGALMNALPGGWIGELDTFPVNLDGELVFVSSPGNAGKLVSTQGLVQSGGKCKGSAVITTRTEPARLVMEFFGANGYMSAVSVNIQKDSATARHYVTGTAPEGAYLARVAVIGNDFTAGNPALTWGDAEREYMPPQGSLQVYLDPVSFGMSADTLWAAISRCAGRKSAIVEGISFDILEVA